jgi:GNAT superfamily N-acetyltransferase
MQRSTATQSATAGLQLLDLHSRPQLITALAQWHYREWGQLYPDESLHAFRTELARAPDANGLPRSWIALHTTGAVPAEPGAPVTASAPHPDANGTAQAQPLLGSISLVDQDLDSAADLSPWLANLWVHPAWRGRGLGSALLDHCVQQAGALRFTELYLYTTDRSAFYARRGWTLLRHDRRSGLGIDILRRGL